MFNNYSYTEDVILVEIKNFVAKAKRLKIESLKNYYDADKADKVASFCKNIKYSEKDLYKLGRKIATAIENIIK